MLTTQPDPIAANWSLPDLDDAIPFCEDACGGTAQEGARPTATALVARLAELEISDIDDAWISSMAGAASELASLVGLVSDITVADPPVAIVRLITKAAMMRPDATGPNTARLHALLHQSATANR